jgi:hypothetical protein
MIIVCVFHGLLTVRNSPGGNFNSDPKGVDPTRIICPSLAVASKPSVITPISPTQSSVIVVPRPPVSPLISFTISNPVELSETFVAPRLLASSSRSGMRSMPMIVLSPLNLDAYLTLDESLI